MLHLSDRAGFRGNIGPGKTGKSKTLIKGKARYLGSRDLVPHIMDRAKLVYEPLHNPWKIEKDQPLTQALMKAYRDVYQKQPDRFDFWDFGTNAPTPISMGIPTIGFGPGEYKLAHMTNEKCEVKKIVEARDVYSQLIKEL
jgi:acetylornithine deacetylase/succinyl-diaminopimelate desuccinylase-like protein